MELELEFDRPKLNRIISTNTQTPDEIASAKERLFGDDLAQIHPNIADVIAEFVADKDITFDDRFRHALIDASELGVSHGETLRMALDAIARTDMDDETTEVSIYGPSAAPIKKLEAKANALFTRRRERAYADVPVSGVMLTEEFGMPDLLPAHQEEVLLLEGIPATLTKSRK